MIVLSHQYIKWILIKGRKRCAFPQSEQCFDWLPPFCRIKKERSMKLENIGMLSLAKLKYPVEEGIQISCSPSGKTFSVLWPSLGRYSVYGFSIDSDWEVIDDGSGCELAWSSTAPFYAVLNKPKDFYGLQPLKKTEDTVAPGEKPIEVDPVSIEPLPVDNGEGTSPSKVMIHGVNEDGNIPSHVGSNELKLGTANAKNIHGGALLGVTATDGAAVESSLRFFSWVDLASIGQNLPSPTWISWESDCTLCAIAYDACVQIFSVYPHFHCLATLSIKNATSSLWQPRQLFIANNDRVYFIYVDGVQRFIQEICIADFHGHTTDIMGTTGSDVFGPTRLRPLGPVRLVGIRHSHLVINDAYQRPFLISLRSHGLRARSLAAKGDVRGASVLASRTINPVLHDSMAEFLLAMGTDQDVELAQGLSGISPELEIAMSIRRQNWDKAARAFQSHSLGISDTLYASLAMDYDNSSGLAVGTFRDTPTIGERNMAAVANILEDEANKEMSVDDSEGTISSDSNGSSSEEYTKSEFVDPIDWDSWESSLSQDEAAKPRSVYNTVGLDANETRKILKAVDMGLQLSDTALDKNRDSARTILGALLAFASVLPKDRLENLVNDMVRGGMTESLRNLTASLATTAPNNPLHSVSIATLLASSVGGLKGNYVVDALHSSGLHPLAFLFSAVWGYGSAERSSDLWKDQILASR